MRKTLVLIGFLFVMSNLQAQNNLFLRFQGGPSLPLSDLASKIYTVDECGGFAKTGLHRGVDIGYFFNENIGIGLMTSTNSHSVDTKTWGEKAFEPDIDSIVEVSSEKWKMNYLMGGIIFRYPINDKFQINARLFGGMLNATSPEIEIYALELNHSQIVIERESAKSSVFQYTIASGVEYRLSEFIAFSLMANYSSGKTEFEYLQGQGKDCNKNSVINISLGALFYFF